MKIYYDSSLWSNKKGRKGLVQRTDWQFQYADAKRCIPAIYRFRKGIVFDVITELDDAKVHAYIDKYEAQAADMTELEQRLAEQEHPFQPLPVGDIELGGCCADAYTSSSSVHIPGRRDDNALDDVRQAYGLSETQCFACQRFCVAYPKAESAFVRLRRLICPKSIKSFKLHARQVHRLVPLDVRFDMPEGDKEVGFVHPLTQAAHKLIVKSAKMIEVPIGEHQMLYSMHASAEVVPQLGEGESLQFSSSMQASVVNDTSPQCSNEAGAIGIIGGADGPTAVFCENGQNCGNNATPMHTFCAVPTFEKQNKATFVMEGIRVKARDSMEWTFEY